MKALFVAGGTGGHVYPALEIARQFKNSGAQIHWIGKENSLEQELSLKEGFFFQPIMSSGFRKKTYKEKIISISHLLFSFIKSIYIFRQIKPNFIFCFGGYLSLGPGLASRVLRIPLFIHEQNSVAGSANKLLVHLARKVFEGFPQSFDKNNDKIHFVGNPVRAEITSFINSNKEETCNYEFKLLILGGSQGSSQLNWLVMEALKKVKEKENWNIIHQTGVSDKSKLEEFYKELKINYKVESFVENMGEVYKNSDLVISRAGAMTISELIATYTPSILLPLPWATDSHQTLNAKYLEDLGAAKVITSEEENISELAFVLTKLAFDNEDRLSMANSAKLAYLPDAAKVIFKEIHESLQEDT
ncbi:MAG TPA: undecaprenyldiphospho-muramoylpentapeptide beta-N-acetylglucosaminyltransferase [Gammaproteobacteria bacterium]|nr:undecaprenyldiphospho-muramoylpentapeptide beta-N-acetylglucosaminyltransferase [Gammaproteobacteria bacterium]